MTNKEKYRSFCKFTESFQGEVALPLFFKDWYLDAVYGEGNWDIAIVEQNQKVIAALPYFLKRKWGFRFIRTLPFGRTMGVFMKFEIKGSRRERKLIQQLIDQLPRFHFFEQNFYYSFINWLPIYWKGFQQTTRYTYVLEGIQDLKSTWKNVSSNYRNNKIKKAKALLNIRTDLSLQQFHDVHEMSFQRQKMAVPFSFDTLKKIDDALAKNYARKIFFAVDKKSQVHSVLYLMWDHQTAYLSMAGDDPSLRKSGAGMWLIWEAIKFSSQDLTLDRFDFQGSMLPGVEKIRRDFGAKQIPYFTIFKFQPSILRLIYDLRKIALRK